VNRKPHLGRASWVNDVVNARGLHSLIVALGLVLILTAGAVAAITIKAPQARMTFTGADGDVGTDAREPDLAYNRRRDEYLLVWAAEGVTDNKFEIYAQRKTDARAGRGDPVRLSYTGLDSESNRDAAHPAVVYNPHRNEYFVVWQANDLAAPGDVEIWGRRVGATGGPIGDAVRISSTGTDADGREAARPSLAANTRTGQYLVAFQAEGTPVAGKFEIFVQRLSPEGAEIGADTRVSTTLPEASGGKDAVLADVAFSRRTSQYLVVWHGDLETLAKKEISGQRLTHSGGKLEGNMQFSETGLADDPLVSAFSPAVAANPHSGQFVIAWEGEVHDGSTDIFGQRVSKAGIEVGSDARLSQTLSDADERSAFDADLLFDAAAEEYILVFTAARLADADEQEVFADRFSTNLVSRGPPLRASRVGADGDSLVAALEPAIEHNNLKNEYVVAYTSGAGTMVDVEGEIYGARISGPVTCGSRVATLLGTNGRDVIRGTKRSDVIVALRGGDVVRGLARADTICGDEGNDRLFGGRGRDRLIGGDGRDFVRQ
jgi:hypothetical protein